MTDYYQQLAAEICPQLVPILRPNYRFFPGREKGRQTLGRGWYRLTGTDWALFEGMRGVIAERYSSIAQRLLTTAGLSEKRRCTALRSRRATSAAQLYLQAAEGLQFNVEDVPFPYALSRGEIYGLLVNGVLPEIY
jgi:hypothetical protein